MALTGKQRRFLRARGHGLAAVVLVGKEGLTGALVAAVDRALLDHELVKVRIGTNAMVDRHDAAAELAERTGAEVAQVLGNTVLLYRPHPEEPVLRLP
ncbi:MAG: ribosome assembly RNA-binding protein YhbY [Deltaproteobacteria bacterium]|nr:MAG: ribosome assembly RNA-binding protein YhbY [Deltaproteobacteria bacterium]